LRIGSSNLLEEIPMTLHRARCLVFLAILVPAAVVLQGSGMFRTTGPADVKPFSQHVERGLARVVWFGNSGIAGEVWMDYGRPAWNEKLEEEIEKPANKRWRFGSDVWTSYESFTNVKAGSVSIPAGYYYAVLEHPAKDKWNLVLLDQKDVRAKKLDAAMASQTSGGISIPLTASKGEQSDRLTIKLAVEEAKPKDVTLEITFGKHKLTAAMKADV
jgi:hypothetical protein